DLKLFFPSFSSHSRLRGPTTASRSPTVSPFLLRRIKLTATGHLRRATALIWRPRALPSVIQPSNSHDHQGLDWLLNSVPGTPGTDYPILAEVPETGFACDGQVTMPIQRLNARSSMSASLTALDLWPAKLPLSQRHHFQPRILICDWWFNFDCAQAEGLYSKNEEVAAEREAAPVFNPSQSGQSSPSRPAPAANNNSPSYQEPALSSYGRQGRRNNGK
ncbi:Putative LOC100114681, partial [Caligus rogercresseyi]